MSVCPVQPPSVCSGGGELCCATTVDNSAVLVCYLKGFVRYILDARLGLWVSLGHTLCVSTTNQAERRSGATHLLARWEHARTTVRWSRAQVGGYPYSRHPLQAQAPFNLV